MARYELLSLFYCLVIACLLVWGVTELVPIVKIWIWIYAANWGLDFRILMGYDPVACNFLVVEIPFKIQISVAFCK
ncbi:hypothetical protein CRG98_046584 [Punica granatum]|uniref:Uncharacterized protein n=1 Tax=Punica granatum TaxID=22663 RepID=A0A2I0HMQ0_PUNGR|nr:hypothetical protein CRG98_046584 [Punica granatum]